MYFEMDIFKWLGRGYMKQLVIINLVVWLAWLSGITLAQLELSEALTGSVSFPDILITCIGNLAVFISNLLRGRRDLDIGARDILATITGPKPKDTDGIGLITGWIDDVRQANVVMMSNHTPHSSIKQFMTYVFHAQGVCSVLLQCLPLKSAAVTAEVCGCSERCRCIVFWTKEEIIIMLAIRIPGTLKRLSDSMCLLPCLDCLRKGCHGCNQGLLHVETEWRLREGDSIVESPAAVSEMLDGLNPGIIEEERTCICIPVHSAAYDVWTKVLIRSLRSKDMEARGFRDLVSDALENYVTQRGGRTAVIDEEYNTASFILPRLVEVLVNIVLTGWFKVDGFSSSLIARRAIRDYVVDSKGTGLAANAFVTGAWVKSNAENTNVCQVLKFRGSLVGVRNLSYIVGCVNLICSIGWGVLIAFEGGTDKWYDIHSMPLSKPRVAVILTAIGIALAMDCLELRRNQWRLDTRRQTRMVWGVIVLEIVCIVTGSLAARRDLGIKNGTGRWVYSALQGLVWLKWAIGSYILGDRDYGVEYDMPDPDLVPTSSLESYFLGLFNFQRRLEVKYRYRIGILVYSSAFLLNAVLAGARGKWEYSPS